MANVEKRGKVWRARFQRPDGTRGSESGFETKQAALDWANDQEARVRRREWHDPRDGAALLADWIELWWSGQDIEPTTELKYRYLIDHHIVPVFGDRPVNTFTSPEEIIAWEKRTRSKGFSHRTASDARSMLGTILGDAKDRGLVAVNAAEKRKGRGRKRTRRAHGHRGPEKAWATPLQVLLLAERCGLLSGQEDDFIMIILTAYTGMRWGEVMGLERPFCRLGQIQVDWQLREFAGRLEKAPPKDESYRAVDLPPFLAGLVSRQVKRAGRCACGDLNPACGGMGQYLFLGPDSGHHRRSNYSRRIFHPATHGRFPQQRQRPDRPVLVDVTQWPGTPLPPWPAAEPGKPFSPPRGRGHKPIPAETPLASWLPTLQRLTPHGLRHGHKTWMAEDGIPEVLQADRLGHIVPGIRGVYTHVSDTMRNELKIKLQHRWETALDERASLSPTSSLPLMSELLAAREETSKEVISIRTA
jgi:integrase